MTRRFVNNEFCNKILIFSKYGLYRVCMRTSLTNCANVNDAKF